MIKKLFSFLLILFIIGIFSYILLENVQQLKGWDWSFSVSWFFLSSVLLILQFVMMGKGWHIILGMLNKKPAFRKVLAIRLLSEIGRYLPGKIWKFVGRIHMSSKLGLRKSTLIVSLFIEEMSYLITAGLITLWSIGLLTSISTNTNVFYLILLVTLIGLYILYNSKLFTWIFNKVLTLLKKPRVDFTWTFSKMTKILIWYFLIWIIFGLSFYSFVRAFIYIPIYQMPIMAGIFIVAWILGYIVVFAPGGLGIREGLLALGLSYYIEPPIAIIISISSRIWLMLVEGLLALSGLLYYRKFGGIAHEQSPSVPANEEITKK